ncbi:MAG: N-methyl-L-tryptophan oxidase [Aggregatilineales bacterium]
MGDSIHSEVLIVGGGGMGLATAWRLAKAGRAVRVIEQFPFFHDRGSSHTEHRIIRRTYEDALYSRLVPHAYQLWSELEADSGQKLMYLCGGVEIGPVNDATLKRLIDIAGDLNVPLKIWSPAEAQKHYPQFHLRPDWLMAYCPDNGFLAVDDCVRAHAEQAAKHGAILQDNDLVQTIEPLDHGARVITAQATYTCDKLIVTAGAYVKRLMRQTGLELPFKIEVNQIQWFRTDPPDLFMPGRFPVFIVRNESDEATGGMYGFPTFRFPGIKVTVHHSKHYIEIEDYDRQPHADTTARVAAFVREFLPGAAHEVLDAKTCLYDLPPDEHFVLSLHPHYPDIVMANTTGHGYKFASLIGEILAQLAVRGTTDYDLTGLSVDRFFSETAVRRPAMRLG